MAFTSQATSSLADCVSKLNTFLAANGWTTHHAPGSGEFAARLVPALIGTLTPAAASGSR